MNKLIDAAWSLHQFFTENKIPYTIIGGFALQFWGEPRFTQDIDVTVLSEPKKEKELVNLLLKKYSSRISNPDEFALKNRIVLLKIKKDVPADISLGIYGYEEGVIERSIAVELEDGKKINICSAEDLIIHKAFAGRPRDVQDIEGVIFRQQNKLDIRLIRKWLKEFSSLLPKISVKENFENPWKKFKKIT